MSKFSWHEVKLKDGRSDHIISSAFYHSFPSLPFSLALLHFTALNLFEIELPIMPTTATAAAASPLFLRPLPSIAPLSLPSFSTGRPAATIPPFRVRYPVTCQAVLSADISSSEIEKEKQLAAAKIGKIVRVTVPLKVCHVQKAPDLDLNGLEGVIKQYVGIWKGKRISANLPFKVEFQIEVEGQTRPLKFVSHLKEDEFQYLD